MKYFLHDTSAFDDEKITELYLKFGYEGLGLFYTALEKIGKQEKPIKTEVLKSQLRVGKRLNKCWKFMEEIGLISTTNGESFNNELLNFSEKYQIKKQKTRERVSEWRDKQTIEKNVTCYKGVSNTPKVKESKVKESKVNNIKEREQSFRTEVMEFNYPDTMLNDFIRYWTEPNKSGTKMRYELQPTWDTKRRLITWSKNDKGIDKPKAQAGA